MKRESVSTTVWFLTLLVLVVVFRLVSWSGRTAIQTDSVSYISSGVNLFQSEGLVDTSGHVLVSKPPFYSVLIGAAWKILGDGEQAARLISFLAGLGIVILIYAMARRIYNPPIALTVMGFSAIYPGLVNSSTAALAESLALFFLLSGTLFLLSLIESWSVKHALLSAIFFSLAVWTRSNAVLIAVSVIPILLCFISSRPEFSPHRVIKPILAFALLLALALQPLMAWNFQHTGKWTLNPESTAWLKVMVESGSKDGTRMEEALSEMGSRSKTDLTVSEVVSAGPKAFFKHILQNAYTFYKETLPKELTPLFLLLSGIGLLTRPTGGYKRLSVFLPFFLPLPVWMMMRGGEPRDVIPLIPAILVLSGAGAVRLWIWGCELDLADPFGKRFFGRLFAGTLLLLAIGFCLPGSLRYRFGNQGQEVEHKIMGEWIRENSPSDERIIMTRKPMVALYADGRSESLVFGNLEDLRLHAVQSDSNFFAMESRTTAKVYPQFSSLMESEDAPDWLSPVHSVEAPDGEKMILYEIIR